MDHRTDIWAALLLHLDWGADEALADTPRDWLAVRSPATPGSRATPGPAAPPGAIPPAAEPPGPGGITPRPPQPAAQATASLPRADAAAALDVVHDLAAWRASYAAFDGCALRATASHFVPPAGDVPAALVWITGAPGDADDAAGQVASGPPGQLLDRMLASIGLSRADLLLAPLLPWRPPGGRPAYAAEIAACLPFLHRLLALARPRLLVIEDGPGTQALLARAAPRDRAREVPVPVPGLDAPVPALILPSVATIAASAARRRQAWQVLRRLHRLYHAALPGN